MRITLTQLMLLGTISLSSASFSADDIPAGTQDGEHPLAAATFRDLDAAIGVQWKIFFDNNHEPAFHPVLVYGDRILAIARDDPSDKRSLSAAEFLMRYGSGISGDKEHRYMTEGMRIALQRHASHPELAASLARLGDGGVPEREIESFLRELLDSSEQPTVRAAAALSLAQHLDDLAYIRSHLEEYTSRLRRAFPEKEALFAALEDDLADRDPEMMRQEAKALLRTVIDEHSNELPVTRISVTRKGLDAAYRKGESEATCGTLAKRLLYVLDHLREGCLAPEIVGNDTTGETFRLSDYRGKVVLLMFSFPSCAACRSWYPRNRELLKQFQDQPFAVLGAWSSMGANDTLESLQSSIESGEVAWRCWWDGKEHPIATRWDVQFWPTLYLIDSHGVIRRQHPPRDLESLKTIIAELMSKRTASSSTQP